MINLKSCSIITSYTMPATRIEISYKTIVFTIFFLLGLNFIWTIRELLFSLFIAFIIVSALKPPVAILEKKGLPRIFSSLLIYSIFLLVIANIFGLIVPSLITETTRLLKSLPDIGKNLSPYFFSYTNFDSLTQYIPNVTNKVFDIAQSIFSNALFIISTLFFGFYLLLEDNAFKKILLKFYDENEIKPVFNIIDKAEIRMNSWFWGEVALMTVIGVMTFIGLNIIGMNYTLALAVLAGLLEAVPNIGPIISLIPAMLIGFSHSYVLGFANIALYFLVQQLENHLIVPLVMRRVVGLNPIITLIALIVGGKLAGVMGVFLSVPTTLFLETILIEVLKMRKTHV